MKRRLRRKLFIGIAAAAVVAGVTAAVVMAAQPGKHHHQRAHHARRAGARTSTGAKRGALAGAAAYLGVSTAQLHSELKGGESLAEIANATSGKSEAGLIAALEANQKAKLAAASANLPRRVVAEVTRVHGNGVQATARRYLAISAAQFRSDLRSGETLAEIASATSGKSEAGLIEALVTAKKSTLAAEVSSGKITQAQANELLPKLSRREAARVKRVRGKRQAHS
jgi:hypothetical protein